MTVAVADTPRHVRSTLAVQGLSCRIRQTTEPDTSTPQQAVVAVRSVDGVGYPPDGVNVSSKMIAFDGMCTILTSSVSASLSESTGGSLKSASTFISNRIISPASHVLSSVGKSSMMAWFGSDGPDSPNPSLTISAPSIFTLSRSLPSAGRLTSLASSGRSSPGPDALTMISISSTGTLSPAT